MIKAMQTLAPHHFCPLTDPQPYQREQDERRRTRARVARSGCLEVISKVQRTTVRRSLHRMVRCLWRWRDFLEVLMIAIEQVLDIAPRAEHIDHCVWLQIV